MKLNTSFRSGKKNFNLDTNSQISVMKCTRHPFTFTSIEKNERHKNQKTQIYDKFILATNQLAS